MTTQIKFSMRGFEEYLERIAQAGKDVDAAADRALLAAAEILQKGMKSRVPVDTGNLRDHIKIKGPEQDGNYHSVEVGVIHNRQYTDADTARYGNVQEYGRVVDNATAIDTEFGSVRKSAHPYIRPTLKGDASKALKAMRESLKEEKII